MRQWCMVYYWYIGSAWPLQTSLDSLVRCDPMRSDAVISHTGTTPITLICSATGRLTPATVTEGTAGDTCLSWCDVPMIGTSYLSGLSCRPSACTTAWRQMCMQRALTVRWLCCLVSHGCGQGPS